MGEEQRQALVRLLAEDEAFRLALLQAPSVDDAVLIAAERGIEVSAEDFAASGELSEAELEEAAGGFTPSLLCTYGCGAGG